MSSSSSDGLRTFRRLGKLNLARRELERLIFVGSVGVGTLVSSGEVRSIEVFPADSSTLPEEVSVELSRVILLFKDIL